IYLDLDVLCVKPFTDLLQNEFVMGEEKIDDTIIGLCNAVILSKKNALFATKWLEGYSEETSLWQGFQSQDWNEMSVKYPYYLSNLYPGDIKKVSYKKFFSPTYQTEELDTFFLKNTNDFDEAYCHHLWNSITYDNYLSKFTEESINQGTSTFCE